MNKVVEHIKGSPAVYTLLATLAGILGVGVSVELPADRAVAEVRLEVAQISQNTMEYRQQQSQYHKDLEVQRITDRMEDISREINRINQIPKYLKRFATDEEIWQIEQYKSEWKILQSRLLELQR